MVIEAQNLLYIGDGLTKTSSERPFADLPLTVEAAWVPAELRIRVWV